MSAPDLVTPRLRLVPVSDSDVDALHAILTDPGVRRYLFDGHIVAPEFTENLVQEACEWSRSDGLGLWLVIEQPTSRPIGFCMLRPHTEDDDAELLYGLLPASWGRGLAVEAARCVISRVFDAPGCSRIFAEMDGPNKASARVAERLGMTLASTRPGPAHTLLRYELRRADFTR